jgi:hypothetical protein
MKLTDPPLFRANPKRQEAQQFVASEPKPLFLSSSKLVGECPHFPLQLIAVLRLHLQGVDNLWRAASTCPAKPQNGAVVLIFFFLQALRFARVHPHPLILSSSWMDGTLKVSLQIPIHSQIEWLMCGKALKIVSVRY